MINQELYECLQRAVETPFVQHGVEIYFNDIQNGSSISDLAKEAIKKSIRPSLRAAVMAQLMPRLQPLWKIPKSNLASFAGNVESF